MSRMAARARGRQLLSKTNAARYLDSLGIAYELREYTVDPEDFSAIAVAERIGLPPEQVFKTLLSATGDREHLFAVVPGPDELDFKKLARACGARKTEMASLKEVEPLTGHVRGGVTVFDARKAFPASVDETLELFEVISVSAGPAAAGSCFRPPTTFAHQELPSLISPKTPEWR